jgi:glycosyltransferase involved in cell wall biosynthesis
MKITFLTVMPSPYVQDLFAALAADDRVELTVWYLEQVAPDTYWGEQAMPAYARVLPGKWYGFSGARVHWNPGIQQLIRDADADLFVIVGYIGLTNQVAMRTLTKLNRPWVFWGEIPGLHQRNWLGQKIRRFLQRPLKSAAGIAAVGSHAVNAYRLLLEQMTHTRASHIVYRNIPYHCRLDEFKRYGAKRQQSDTVRFLYCGQLIHRKGVDLLCRAFCELLQTGANARLTLAGEGPLKESLQQAVPERYRDRVIFLGFQSMDALPRIFGDADVFVLPSRHDGWGVVVNQAVAAGLPVIATEAVGAAEDLVQGQGTGWVIPADDEQAILNAMQQAIAEQRQLPVMSRNAFNIAKKISMDQAVADWSDLFETALAG